MISVFIVAASPLVRAGLENLLVSRQIEVASSVASLDDLEGRLDDTPADAILVDSAGEPFEVFLDSVNASGLASDFSVVLLVEPAPLAASSAALRAGVRAVLPKDISADQLATALHAVSSGLLVLEPAQVPALMNANGFASVPARSREFAEALTPRESEVLQMLASGLGNKEIAKKLSISEHTVKFHVASILGKLGAGSRTEAVSLGIRRGLVLL
ncbi:MAG TPA: response regulator transcription factor [Candidatus Dormibacteraeota bacterium]|nr:response regulator transcription factor [Candidatus Dormibacteraeota bacterium]